MRNSSNLKWRLEQVRTAVLFCKSQWEGFERFCRDVLGVEAPTVIKAYELVIGDAAEETGRLPRHEAR